MHAATELGDYGFYADHDYGYGGSVSTDDNNQDEGSEDEVPLWDTFECTEPRPNSGSMVDQRGYELLLRFVKLGLYGLLFGVSLAGIVLGKASLLFASSQLAGRPVPYCYHYAGRSPAEEPQYQAQLPEAARMPWLWCLILAFAAPELLNLLRFVWNYFFVKMKLPGLGYIGLLSIVEVLHTVGLALLFLVVLPDLDVVQAAAALTCVCIVPNVFGLLTKLGQSQKSREPYQMYGDAAALCCQLAGLLSFTYLAYQSEDAFAPWTLPIALILSSLRWWENYVSCDTNFGFIRSLVLARRNLQAFRVILIGYSALLRIVTFVLSALLITLWKGIKPNTFFEGFYMKTYNYTVFPVNTTLQFSSEVAIPPEEVYSIAGDRLIPVYVLLINVVSGICVYSCAKFACRTLMQNFGFAVPVSLAVPTTVGFLWLLCCLRAYDVCYFHQGLLVLPDHLFFYAPGIADYATKWYAWIWMLWLLSQLWITVHIWRSTNKRLATTDKIFSAFSYDALLIEQSLALSKWRHEPEDDNQLTKIKDLNSASEQDEGELASSMIKDKDRVTQLYACATMWHERPEEMMDFLNSILRMDQDRCAMRVFKKNYGITRPDYYELEVHIFFDDAFECVHGCSGRCIHDENKTQANSFVVDFVRVVEKCMQARRLRISPPVKYPTPYGGRLVWSLPERTKMYVHLKDKNRIRTRKRWSQVMYMYYLLGYRLMQLPIHFERKKVIAANTYLLTLDGDIDFRPSAVRKLIDRMKINKKLGSACGRIHPLGRGPLVWFQQFEYAVGHWLQKSTEHTIGCVLCSPGCFALFRAGALMNHNVMNKYAAKPTEARHYIQYDQGEDRWLCTLLLQKGYRVEYSAASDAYTHAPEGFNEFFIQRRRWIPSTIANIMDLLSTAKDTKKNNPDISSVYIFYQWILMGSTILGPGTIFLMLVGAFVAAFSVANWTSFCYNLIPVLIFCLVCYCCTEKTQLSVAAIITTIYGLVMIVVLVGIMIQISEDGWFAPTTVLFLVVIVEFLITALLHPLEFGCLKYACIYYVTVPSMYLLLIIFSLFNMNNVSWGTRDVAKPPTDTEEEEQQPAKKKNDTAAVKKSKKEKGTFEFSLAGLFKCMFCTQELPRDNDDEYKEVTKALLRIEDRLEDRHGDSNSRSTRDYPQRGNGGESGPLSNPSTRSVGFADVLETGDESESSSDRDSSSYAYDGPDSLGGTSGVQESDNFLVSPNWLYSKELGKGEVEFLGSEEEIFWRNFIGKYLEPIDKNVEEEKRIAKDIKDLRDQYIFKFFMINALFVLIIFLMQLKKEILHLKWPFGMKYNITYIAEGNEVRIDSEYLRLEPIGFVFILGFLGVLLIQFVAMLFHRFETFSHIMANVSLDLYCCDKAMDLSEDAITERMLMKLIKKVQQDIDKDAENEPEPGGWLKGPNSLPRRSYAKSFGSTLQESLSEPTQIGKGGLLSKRASQMLQRRRTIVQEERDRRHQQFRSPETGSGLPTPGAESRPQEPKNFVYENPTFVGDERL